MATWGWACDSSKTFNSKPSRDGDEEADADEAQGPTRLEKGDIRLLVMGDADMIDDRLVGA